MKEFSSAQPKDSGDPKVVNPNLPFGCSKCSRGFKSASGRATHLRFCSKTPTSTQLPQPTPTGQTPTGPTWMSANGITAKEAKPFRKKLLHWVLVRKNQELKRGVACWKKFGCYQSKSNIELKHRLQKAAGTILTCLKGNHINCQYSFVCENDKDPYCYLLPHKRPVSSPFPDSIQKSINESIWSVFNTDKLDKLINNGKLRTTSCVESVHRTIRNPVPKGKSLPKNQTAVLQSGASVAASNGKGLATVAHFRALNLPVSANQAKKMQRLDQARRQNALCRKTARYRKLASVGRRSKFESHSRSLESKEALMYRKDAFAADHGYARSSSLTGELNHGD